MDTTPFPDSLENGRNGDNNGGDDNTHDDLAGQGRRLSAGFLSKVPFLRTHVDDNSDSTNTRLGPVSPVSPGDTRAAPKSPSRAMAVAVQQQKTRRRKGSLRKAALLGRGAQRDRKDVRTGQLENSHREDETDGTVERNPPDPSVPEAFGLGIMDAAIRPREEHQGRTTAVLSPIATRPMDSAFNLSTYPPQATSPTLTYTSTTDDEDILSIPTHSSASMRAGSQTSTGSASYFPSEFGTRHRSFPQPKSPLGIGGLAANTLPVSDGEWDYSETEWWGWVVLIVTWIVFVTGMGSCFGVWSWAWDVGETPYAPPELEDDPTLPIVGYYPALIILTAVMAWVWVVVAWVGMKYFRHAKISGD